MISGWKQRFGLDTGEFTARSTLRGTAVNLGPSEIVHQLTSTFESAHYRPPVLPRVATEILRITQSRDVRLSAIEKLLEEDQMLAARVLKVSRSPLFTPSSSNSVQTIKDALVRLGLNALRDIVLDISLQMRVFRSETYGPEMQRVARHTRATAYIARVVAKHSYVPGEYAFLCGLFHDIGIAGALIVLGEPTKGEESPDVEEVWPAVDQVHQKLSSIMAGHWQMPPEVEYVVGRHHDIVDQGEVHPICAIVCVAEHLANTLHRSIGPAPGPAGTEIHVDLVEPSKVRRSLEVLQIERSSLNALRQDAKEAVDSLTS
jgi:HD-like signal output (HDOD) protein